MPFEPLMFFGDNGGGDQFAFVSDPRARSVFVWGPREGRAFVGRRTGWRTISRQSHGGPRGLVAADGSFPADVPGRDSGMSVGWQRQRRVP